MKAIEEDSLTRGVNPDETEVRFEAFNVPPLIDDTAGTLSTICSNGTFIYLAYFYSKESIRNAVTEPA